MSQTAIIASRPPTPLAARLRRLLSLTLVHTVLMAGAVFMLLPFVFMLVSSIKPPGEIFEATFRLWHEKAKIVRLVVVFLLSMRYLDSLSAEDRKRVEAGVVDQLGHIEALRDRFSGGDQQ